MQQYIARDLRLKSLPAWIAKLDLPLKVIDVSGNPSLSLLPMEELCGMRDLKEVRCRDCAGLSLPPPEIAQQGGKAVMTYLRQVRVDGKANKRISLILMGSGEAGKTIVLQALKSQQDRAGKIDAEEGRTIGIDLHAWEPELKAMTSDWLRAIHARVPGASVMLVATHIDLAESEEALQQQCKEVKRCVQEEHKKMSEEEDEMILPLNVLNDGESFQVNCLRGDGIAKLRKSVCEAAKGLLWWKEKIPRAILRLKEVVVKRSHQNAVIDVREYVSLVEVAKVNQEDMKIATRMLHEMGVLKYFGKTMEAGEGQSGGDFSFHNRSEVLNIFSSLSQCFQASLQNRTLDSDIDLTINAEQMTAGQGPSKEEEQRFSFEDTVFIDPAWMIEVFKGVMRHDWRHLLESSQDDPIKSKKVKKLLHLGIIDEDILKELWQQVESRETQTSGTNKVIDETKAVALLRGCDLAHFLEGQAEGKTTGKRRDASCCVPASSLTSCTSISEQSVTATLSARASSTSTTSSPQASPTG